MKNPTSPSKRAISVVLTWGLGLGIALSAATPGIHRNFEAFLVEDRTRLPIFFREIPPGKLDGLWQTGWAMEGAKALLDSRLSSREKRPHVTAWYDERKRPVRVDEWNPEKSSTLEITWREDWPEGMVWRTLDRNGLETGVETWEIARGSSGEVLQVHIARQGHTSWAENYHARSNELLIVALYPGGGLRELRVYAGGRTADEPLKLKERRFRERNATFETLGVKFEGSVGEKAPRITSSLRVDEPDGFRAVMGLVYSGFADADRETIWENPADPWSGRVLIRERGELPLVEYRKENRLFSIVTLEKAAAYSNQASIPDGHPFSGFSDGSAFWGDYTVAELGIDPQGARVERRYRDGLLRQTAWLDRTGEVKRTALDYYPDRTPCRERCWIRGERIEQRLFHGGESSVTPAPIPGAGFLARSIHP
jgi:hypothetical protein